MEGKTSIRPARRILACAITGAMLASLAMASCQRSRPVLLAVAGPQNFLNAVRMALEDAEDTYGPLRLDTLMVDEGGNQAAPAILNARLIASTGGVAAVIGHSNSAASIAASQIYNAAEIVQLAPTSTAVRFAAAGPYSFRMVPSDDRQGRFIGEWVSERWPGGARLAILYVNDDYGRGLRRALLESLSNTPHEMALDLPHTEAELEQQEVDQVVDAVQAASPTVILWLSRGSQLRRVLPPLRTRLGPIPVIGGDALSSSFSTASYREWGDVSYVEFIDLETDGPARKFQERYHRRFGVTPRSSEVLSYDAAMVIIDAIRAGARTGPDVRRYLETLGDTRPAHEGISGRVAFAADRSVHRDYVRTALAPVRRRVP